MDIRLSRRAVLGGLGLWAASLTPGLGAQGPGPRMTEVPTASGRTCSTWQYEPTGRRRGTILFMHGALSAPWKHNALFAHWQAADYAVLAPLHVDSTDHPGRAQFPGLTSWAGRIEDMRAVVATITEEQYVAAGHSYGAMAALALGGAAPLLPEGVAGPLRDRRAAAVLAFSPPGAMPPLIDASGYASLAVPALIQTGTADVLPGRTGWEEHLLAWEQAPPGEDCYAMVLDGVDHYFGGAIGRPELPGPPQSEALAIAAARSMEMVEAFLQRRGSARRHLDASLSADGPTRFMRR